MLHKLDLPILIQCPLHSSEAIQRVDLGSSLDKHLFCTECILKSEKSISLLSTLETIPHFLENAVKVYQENKKKVALTAGPPLKYSEMILRQAEVLDSFTNHIGKEKEKVTKLFDEILAEVESRLNHKKEECLAVFDKQLSKLCGHYEFFESQLKKAYPKAEDIAFVFPSKEELEARLLKVTNAVQLEALVKEIKQDITQNTSGLSLFGLTEQTKVRIFEDLSKILEEQEHVRPTFDIGNWDTTAFNTALNKTFESLFANLITVRNPILDQLPVKIDFESTIVNADKLKMIKAWIPKKYQFNLKLLYRSSRDGNTPKAFHANCDEKGPTLTVIKCTFDGSSAVSVIGGFSDQNWKQDGTYTSSNEAFLFSVTSPVKCLVSENHKAIYGGIFNGPRFGSCDLQIYGENFQDTYVHPHSYSNTKRLVESAKYHGSGKINFKLIDVEVYEVH